MTDEPSSGPSAWARFWFGPEPARNLAAARILLAAAALWVVLSRHDLPSIAAYPPELWAGVSPERRLRFLMVFGAGLERALYAVLHAALVFAIVGLWLLVAPGLPAALTGVLVHFALALHYEWVHFLVHTRYRPRSARYEKLWRNHRLHHFKNEHYWYGVTMLSGDRLLGTAPDRDAVPTSPTARTLGLETSLGDAA